MKAFNYLLIVCNVVLVGVILSPRNNPPFNTAPLDTTQASENSSEQVNHPEQVSVKYFTPAVFNQKALNPTFVNSVTPKQKQCVCEVCGNKCVCAYPNECTTPNSTIKTSKCSCGLCGDNCTCSYQGECTANHFNEEGYTKALTRAVKTGSPILLWVNVPNGNSLALSLMGYVHVQLNSYQGETGPEIIVAKPDSNGGFDICCRIYNIDSNVKATIENCFRQPVAAPSPPVRFMYTPPPPVFMGGGFMGGFGGCGGGG